MTHSDFAITSDKVLERQLRTQCLAGTTLLDCVALPQSTGYLARLFFKSGTRLEDISTPHTTASPIRSGNGAVILDTPISSPTDPIALDIEGQSFSLTAEPVETSLFAGLNVLLAIRNGESPKTAATWMQYHATQHGMQAAVILDQTPPDESRLFIRELRNLAHTIKGLSQVVVIHSEIPLGQKGLPAEAHPLNVRNAPIRDWSARPPIDPWRAPLGECLIYEIIRRRFLSAARAVANIDLYDLLAPPSGPNVFDRAVQADDKYIRLLGAQTYPWRVRRDQDASFADHICTAFDSNTRHPRWCVAPGGSKDGHIWQQSQIIGAIAEPTQPSNFFRNMVLRHPTRKISHLVAKGSLLESPELLTLSLEHLGGNPVRMPEKKRLNHSSVGTRTSVVTTMKNEGPFILEWLAYHRVIGVDDFLIYTNDCTDGTDALLRVLQDKEIVQHRDNPLHDTKTPPQHAAFQAAQQEPLVRDADWILSMDVDEFINIKCGDGYLSDLYAATQGANMIAMTWRLFGNNDVSEFSGELVTREFTRCAYEITRRPHQAWGFKTLFRNDGIFKKLGVHRPKGLRPHHWRDIHWVNGSGQAMPQQMFRSGWRSTIETYGYDLVQLNHYAVRSAESFLVKRDRGRVNHTERDQGLPYWFRMNNNSEEERSIQRLIPELEAEMARLLSDPDIAAAHDYTCRRHREQIDELKKRDDMRTLYQEITGDRLRKLSRMHAHFCTNVFLNGPDVIPDELTEQDLADDFFFTVPRTETKD
ncbi:glycosyltransferase family 2 protein [Phaeobacter gallaeciensis]|uniref:Glycosyl transferase family 2 n=1 Tax=Phaeobacter gallaeciensis TaxID=60890 RepID=A0AAD0EDB7_9RHOB|nr:glycosyltransferase family 2 protein [Phaeobacter gallaeciensis]AHD11629.1 Glycosyl transferase family 2 [Phaeobacter gallaeciensis DSM 26640]ATE94893.1 Glycosyl transferase family 2 [Phaeobacter gallaeciensis]ATE99164.1 Glycosyl transferase family 2 [Phaeobacter gallaeciensis]ATF03557.1 Glycosyl transferase family 2 [Phaeobacter gallaeciensis]ATF07937.1 Glycosyl transferase family 2 [Phaeobacter gallaeciensis]